MNARLSIGQFQPYPAYRPSGVEWLSDVPEHWGVARLKGHAANVVDLARRKNEDHIYLSLENVEGWTGRYQPADEEVTFDSQVKRFEAGDVLFGKLRPYLAKVACPNQSGVCVGEFLVLRPYTDTLLERYLGQLLRSKPAIDAIDASTFGAKMPRADWQFTGNMLFPLPPLPEQRAIVRYLDYVDRRIRRYVDAKRKLIALIEEERQAVINRAVTRGLDPNVGLKPSGVEWLGDVPEHWERCRLRNVVSVVTTGSRGWSSYASDTGPLFIRVANLSRGSLELRFDDTVRLDLPKTSEMARTRIQRGDLLVSVTAYIGSIAVAPDEFEEAYVSQHVARCQPLPGSSSRWLGYVLLSTVGQTHGQISLYGGTKDGLSLDDVKDYPMLIPPLDEQTSIVKHLERATAAIDAAITRARRQVELVEEYRTRLIADVVTGKLDVREAAAQLPDEAEDDVPIGEGDLQQNGMAGALHNAEEEPAFAEEVTA